MYSTRLMHSGLQIAASLIVATVAWAQPGPQGGIYRKPYLSGENQVKVGGYVDMEWKYDNPTTGKSSNTFDQHRLIPFFFAEVTPELHFSTEIEFEHGGNPDKDGEIKIEYMVVDYRFSDAVQFRTGIILAPLGRFNLVHDSPVNDLTDRPLVNRRIIPTTLSEAGVGFFGVLYPSEMSVVNYEVYVVNGFGDSIIADVGTGKVRLRSGRGSLKSDNNENKAILARIDYSPRLGLNLGFSAHHGAYDSTGTDKLTIVAIDGIVRKGPLELLFEMAQARTERSHLSLGTVTQMGYYVQGNVHFLQDRLIPGSTFTGVVRYDFVDYGKKGMADDRISRFSVGLNFRPVEKAVFKTEIQTNWTQQPGMSKVRQNQRILGSVAVYF